MLYTEDFTMRHYVRFSQIGSHLCSVTICLRSKILIYMGKQLQYICQQMIFDGISIVLYCVVMVTFYFGGLYLEKVTK